MKTNTYGSRTGTRRWVWALTVLAVGISGAVAQNAPFYIGTTTPIENEFGTANVAGNRTMDLAERCRVEILRTLNGTNDTPTVDGEPSADNVLLFTSSVGAGVVSTDNPGTFAVAVSNHSSFVGQQLFARAFNAPTREDASFYTDSEVFTVAGGLNDTYDLTFEELQPLDTADDDGDGLNNSWEQSYGSDPNLMDTDGDGMTDGEEHRAGTDPTDANSIFVVFNVEFNELDQAVVTWASGPNRRYQVEYTPGDLVDGDGFASVGDPVDSQGNTTSTIISSPQVDEDGYFRVRVVD